MRDPDVDVAIAFTPPVKHYPRDEVGVWITEKLAAVSDQLPDLEYRVARDRARFPTLPDERGALMESVVFHEMGHVVQNWYKSKGFYDVFVKREDAFKKEIGGTSGVHSLVSDYAVSSIELFPEVMSRLIHENAAGAVKTSPSLRHYLNDVINGMWAIEEHREACFSHDVTDTVRRDANIAIWKAMFGAARKDTLPMEYPS